jgi:hypothetical protein
MEISVYITGNPINVMAEHIYSMGNSCILIKGKVNPLCDKEFSMQEIETPNNGIGTTSLVWEPCQLYYKP